ncbi:MAG: MgtC/SapB family protein, partial [Actinomycetota bacterium]
MVLELAAEAAPELAPLDMVARVLGSALLGGLVGLERELKNRPAGFRTHILVSLGACLFTMAGAYGARVFYGAEGAADLDPTRVAAQVVTGIGFLGAGAIIRTGANVQGLTTAAALWVTAAIGLAVGLGFWGGAAAVAGATLTALYGLK